MLVFTDEVSVTKNPFGSEWWKEVTNGTTRSKASTTFTLI